MKTDFLHSCKIEETKLKKEKVYENICLAEKMKALIFQTVAFAFPAPPNKNNNLIVYLLDSFFPCLAEEKHASGKKKWMRAKLRHWVGTWEIWFQFLALSNTSYVTL